MTKTRMILLTSLALMGVLAVCVLQARAESGPSLRMLTIPHGGAIPQEAPPPAAVPLIQQGMTAMGPTPPVTGVVGGVQTGPPSWPCFPTAAPCTSDPAGGYLAALPEEVFSLTTCEIAYDSNDGTGGCGQAWWTFEVSGSFTCPAAGCPLSVAITAQQGANTVYSLPLTNIGTIPSAATEGGPYTEVIYGQQGFGTTWGATVNPAAGNVTLTVTSQVGTGPNGTTKVAAKGTLVVALH
jgi:hypothetical protein